MWRNVAERPVMEEPHEDHQKDMQNCTTENTTDLTGFKPDEKNRFRIKVITI